MTDPRNVAHDKRVQQEKKNKGEDITTGTTAAPQPGKKPHMEKHATEEPTEDSASKSGVGTVGQKEGGEHEKR